MPELSLEVKALAKKEGAHLVGIASVDRFAEAPKGHHPTDLVPGAKSVVVLAHRYFQSVLESDRLGLESDLIPKDQVWEVQQTIFRFMYNTANMRLQMIASQIAAFLEEHGYSSLPLPAGGYKVASLGKRQIAFFSHRHAAVLAGLGEFGLNNLLLTPKYGPRIRLESMITTAELTPDPMTEGPICLGEDACGLCLKSRECFGDIHELVMAGKKMELAHFTGGCNSPNGCKRNNPDGELPYIRYCWGVCPVGKNLAK